jgi:hypothetical protein
MLLETTSLSFFGFLFSGGVTAHSIHRSETPHVIVTLGLLSITRLRSKTEYSLRGETFRQRAKYVCTTLMNIAKSDGFRIRVENLYKIRGELLTIIIYLT